MADNNAGGQDTRLPGASDFSSAPSDCTASKGGPISAKTHGRSKKLKGALKETSPEPSIGKSACSSSSNSPSTKSNKRTHFTPQQIYKLEQFFLKNQFPTAKDRENLAKELQLSSKHIQVWFQNHRAKYKRKEKKKEATQKSTVKLQPPSSWPAKLPFDSSIASVNLGSSVKVEDKKKESTSVSVSPSHSFSSVASGDISASTLRSSLSPEKLTPYPLSPSSPLPTPHAPVRKQSSSLAPESPLSSAYSPVATSQLGAVGQLSPSSQTSSTPSRDTSLMYTSEMDTLNLFDINVRTNEFSPPILAESPVHLYDLLDDPDIVSVLREHMPPSKHISAATDSDFNLPFQSYYQNPRVGYGHTQQFHSSNFPLPITPTPSHISSSTDQGIQQLHSLAQQEAQKQQSLSRILHSKPRSIRPPFPLANPYRPSVAAPLHASGPYTDVASPQYSVPPAAHHNQPFAQVYVQDPMNYQSLPPMDSRFQNRPPHPNQLLPIPQTTQVQSPIYHPGLPPPPPCTPVTTSSMAYQQSSNKKPPSR